MRTQIKAQCAALALLAFGTMTSHAAETLHVVTFGGAFEAAHGAAVLQREPWQAADHVQRRPRLLGGEERTHEALFWEMDGQTAMRAGNYKLVLNGRLVEGEEQRAEVFLSDLSVDPGEHDNLAEKLPEVAAEMREKALAWRAKLEKNWDEKFAANYRSLT